MLTLVNAVTALVVMLNVALVAPAATVTLAGTDAAGLLLESATCAPPAGAGPFSVTVPELGLPPVTLAGTAAAGLLLVSVTCWPPAGAGPFSVTVPVAEAPPVRLVGLSASAEIIG